MSRDRRRVWTRRDFVRGTVSSAVAASVLGTSGLLRAQPAEETPPEGDEAAGSEDAAVSTPAPDRSRVVIVRHPHVMDDRHDVDAKILGTMLDSTLTRLTGQATAEEAWASLFSADDVVGLVPTGFMNKTNPELIAAVTAALVGLGVSESNIIDVQGDDVQHKKCTALICMPALKAHWLTGIGTVLKNYIMFSGKPSSYHKENSTKLGEIWNLPDVKGKTRLVLVDALRAMCSKGPQPDPRYKWDYKGLIASFDPVAADAIGLRIISNKRDALKGEPWPLNPPAICVEAAEKDHGLGFADPDRIDVDLTGWDQETLI